MSATRKVGSPNEIRIRFNEELSSSVTAVKMYQVKRNANIVSRLEEFVANPSRKLKAVRTPRIRLKTPVTAFIKSLNSFDIFDRVFLVEGTYSPFKSCVFVF
jgi:hypothetical protein